jgi:RHH-type proline utilization regulon transcriptional repressor/proline dehydrogenase/delta 1-pyrroline-5-carboxylate dehydrogenase
MITLDPKWDLLKRQNERLLIEQLTRIANLNESDRQAIVERACNLVGKIRNDARPGLMDVFLAEYGLSTSEGVALMCLAEALLRVPDNITIDALIEDKIAPSDWSKHIGHSASPLVNASTWGLLLTGKVLDQKSPGLTKVLRNMIKRLGEPVVRTAVSQAMREMGRQFVLGESIRSAMKRAEKKEAEGFTYSYDMLGEAAMTMRDARRYQRAYSEAIGHIAMHCKSSDITRNPGISVKLSALHPRYEIAKADRLRYELLPTLKVLAKQAADAQMGLNIDAEEADRLALSMTLIESLLADPDLADWDGLGIVVQAYGRRAAEIIDGLYEMAARYQRKIMVRLVKGAYWDTEIKRAQVAGLEDFPVFTAKAATDISFIANARKLLGMTDLIYPQFATHNAHSVAAILHMAKALRCTHFEFQRLHGMGESLHDFVQEEENTRCRIYAPVGTHRDLLAYLVRRLLENGANSSFVNQIVNSSIPVEKVAACPFDALTAERKKKHQPLMTGPELFLPERKNSRGFDLNDIATLQLLGEARKRSEFWRVGPQLANPDGNGEVLPAYNPATGEHIGACIQATAQDIKSAFAAAQCWKIDVQERCQILQDAAQLYEENFGDILSLLTVEAGKTLADAVAELRESVDFLRYYASQAPNQEGEARGIFVCISPWNFPLAIFTGQVAAALATGNAVLAKPAETTPAIAAFAVELLHRAGVPHSALQLLTGEGATVGHALTSDKRVKGVAFTGSTATARKIQSNMAAHLEPGAPLIAETGGLNAMIVDSTALPEQAVRDIVASAFQSAGQRCSALRCLYVQEDIAELICEMLIGAMNELELGDPWQLSTDIGPVITATAQTEIATYIAEAASEGRLLHQLRAPAIGNFVGPALISVDGIGNLDREVFGPVLHLATFRAGAMSDVIDDINASGYGLTFGIHTRIDSRVQTVANQICAGNIYANRNQVGAVVGSQPFGGEGLSGTGPKAGGPHYLQRFLRKPSERFATDDVNFANTVAITKAITAANQAAVSVAQQFLPGPTGELNRLDLLPRAPVLCLGPGTNAAKQQKALVEELGGIAIPIAGRLDPVVLKSLPPFSALIWWGNSDQARLYAQALAKLEGPILPLITDLPDAAHCLLERHLCVDTTAAGGNSSLLAAQ